jgi:predicted DNA-binding transcriptional regulator YafY
VRVRAGADDVRRGLPPGLAVVEALPDDDGAWVRVRLRAERLDWVPGVLAGLGAPFVVEEPDALRGHVRALAQRLTDAAR